LAILAKVLHESKQYVVSLNNVMTVCVYLSLYIYIYISIYLAMLIYPLSLAYQKFTMEKINKPIFLAILAKYLHDSTAKCFKLKQCFDSIFISIYIYLHISIYTYLSIYLSMLFYSFSLAYQKFTMKKNNKPIFWPYWQNIYMTVQFYVLTINNAIILYFYFTNKYSEV